MSSITKPVFRVPEDSTPTTQLSYTLQVSPSPITVSIPQEDPILASLEFVVTNLTGSSLLVRSITFTIQVGPGASLTPTTAGISTSVSDTTDWILTAPAAPVTCGSASYTLGPVCGSAISLAVGASVVVQISQIQTNFIPGNSTVEIKELIGSTPTFAFTRFVVTTFPDSFYFNGLAAALSSDKNLIPVAQVDTGSTVTLTWNSSVVDISAFTIYYSNASLGQQKATPSDIGEWTSPSLSSDTVFTVVVKTSVQGGQPLTSSLSTTVSVRNPSLVAADVQVNNYVEKHANPGAYLEWNVGKTYLLNQKGSGVGGFVMGEVDNVNTITEQMSIDASGKITANGAGINGALSANSATISGALSANNISANGAAVNGALSANSATISGALTANNISADGATVNGTLRIGSWTISVDSNNNLNFTNGTATFQLGNDGVVNSNNNRVICDNSPISIYSPARGASLNASDHFGGGCDGYVAAAYWMENPDGDSNLSIHFGNPY
ncbi:MAG TPA: hypothetical protein VIF37_14895 [Methylobacter sp.]|jgi:hypothetical protein